MARPKNGPLLTQTQIVQAALKLLETEGIETLSVRRVASDLGVDPMALYYHIPGKDALLRQVVEAVVAELKLPGKQRKAWQDQVRGLCRAYRQLALHYPKTFPLVLAFPDFVPSDFRIAEACLGIFEEAGFSARTALRTFIALQAFVEGFVLDEVTHVRSPKLLTIDFDSGKFPNLKRLQTLNLKDDPEADFEFGLTLLIAGLTATHEPKQ
jgi:AcrR family transcriptional regulator